MTLRAYQTAAVQAVREAFADGSRAPLLVMPTGGGKTQVFSHIASTVSARAATVLIVAHRRELIKQASAKLFEAGVYHGIVGKNGDRAAVQVGSVQTLANRLSSLPRFDLIIMDEAHHAVAGGWARLIESQPRAMLLGVTATPERLDGRGLGVQVGGAFDKLILGPSMADLQADGWLAPLQVFAPATPPKLLNAVRVIAGDYSADDLAHVMDTPKVTGDAIEHYGWHSPGQPAIAFCATVAHAEHTAESFRAAGWRAVAVHGKLEPGRRDAALAGLGNGAFHVVTSCSLIDEGLDVPSVGAVIDLAPTQSLSRFLQRVGRGLRPGYAPGSDLTTAAGRLAGMAAWGGKRRLMHLDHAGNTLRHGMPEMVRPWSLDGVKRRARDTPATKQCPTCYAIHSPAPRCPACGYDYEVAAAASARKEIERVAGELALMTADDRRIAHLRTAPLKELLAGAGYDRLVEIGEARGFKPGWAEVRSRYMGRPKYMPTGGSEFDTGSNERTE